MQYHTLMLLGSGSKLQLLVSHAITRVSSSASGERKKRKAITLVMKLKTVVNCRLM